MAECLTVLLTLTAAAAGGWITYAATAGTPAATRCRPSSCAWARRPGTRILETPVVAAGPAASRPARPQPRSRHGEDPRPHPFTVWRAVAAGIGGLVAGAGADSPIKPEDEEEWTTVLTDLRYTSPGSRQGRCGGIRVSAPRGDLQQRRAERG